MKLSEKIEKLYNIIKISQDPFSLLKKLTYPYGLKEFTNNFRFSLRYMNNWEEKNNIKFRSQYNEAFFSETSLKFKSGFELLEKSLDHSGINPILTYYGVNQVYSAIIDLTFDNIYRSRGHGIINNPRIKNDQIQWNLKLDKTKYGFFRKFALLVDCLDGSSEFVKNIFFNGNFQGNGLKFCNGVLIRQGKKEIVIDLVKLNKNYWENHNRISTHDYDDQIVFRYLNLFAFCSTLRYNPDIWLKLQKGTHQIYNTYKDLDNKIIFDILWLLEKRKMPYRNPDFLFDRWDFRADHFSLI